MITLIGICLILAGVSTVGLLACWLVERTLERFDIYDKTLVLGMIFASTLVLSLLVGVIALGVRLIITY